MKLIARQLAVFALCLQLLICSVVSYSSFTQQELDDKTNSTAQYLSSLPVSQVGSIGGEWRILGLARAAQ